MEFSNDQLPLEHVRLEFQRLYPTPPGLDHPDQLLAPGSPLLDQLCLTVVRAPEKADSGCYVARPPPNLPAPAAPLVSVSAKRPGPTWSLQAKTRPRRGYCLTGEKGPAHPWPRPISLYPLAGDRFWQRFATQPALISHLPLSGRQSGQ